MTHASDELARHERPGWLDLAGIKVMTIIIMQIVAFIAIAWLLRGSSAGAPTSADHGVHGAD